MSGALVLLIGVCGVTLALTVLVSTRSTWPPLVRISGVDWAEVDAWLGQERTRLLASFLLGGIAVVATVVAGLRAAVPGAFLWAGGVASLVILVFLLGVPASPLTAVEPGRPSPEPARVRPPRPRDAVLGATGVYAAAALLAWGSAATAIWTEDGWALSAAHIVSPTGTGRLGPMVPGLGGFLWFGWPDALVATVLGALIIGLFGRVVARFASDTTLSAPPLAEVDARVWALRRRFVVMATLVGGLLQLAVASFLLGVPLFSLLAYDSDPAASQVSVMVEPYSAIGMTLLMLGAVALVACCGAMAAAFVALFRLGDGLHPLIGADPE